MSRNKKKNISKKRNNNKKKYNKKKYNDYNNLKAKLKTHSKSKFTSIKAFTTFLIILFVLLISISLVYLLKNRQEEKIELRDLYLENNQIIVELNNDAQCSLDSENWVHSRYKTCTFDYITKIDNIYIKYKDIITKHDISKDFSIVNEIHIENNKMYLAISGEEKINYSLVAKGIIEDRPVFTTQDDTIAKVSEDGIVTGISKGETVITIKLRDKEDTVSVIVTDLIVKRPEEFNYNRSYLTCNRYTKEENDLFDEILRARVDSVGRGTRAAVAEVARFIGLEFPYRLNYFSENGRLNANKKGIDGEGRYYHEGLFLHSSRFKNLSSSLYGPGTWGCRFYSIPPKLIQTNGLDCSGFVSWAMLNAGFDVGDLGAGISSGKDLTDLGTRIRMTTALDEGKVRVGDLLSQEVGGEHIAIVAGLKNGYYFVAESLWYGTGYLGMVIRKYDKAEFIKNFYWLVDMSTFYEEDGKLTDYWEY